MKKNYLKLISPFLLASLLIIGCQKETKETTPVSDLQSASGKQKNKCRLIYSSSNDAFSYSNKFFHYNDAGLCDLWTIEDDLGNSFYRQRYDASGRLIGSEWNYEGDLITTIEFTYENGRIIKDTWYLAGTTDIFDETWYTYNAQGQIVRNESFLNDWYVISKYSPKGNVLSGELFFGGSPYFSFYYTYNRPVKNPNKAVPGISHFFPYYMPTYAASKFYNAGEKEVFYDEDGAPIVMFDYDPEKTVWQVGSQNYALSTDCYDMLSGNWFNYSFEFENCGPGKRASQTTKPPTGNATGKRLDIMNMLRRNPKLPVKEQFKQIRSQLKNLLKK